MLNNYNNNCDYYSIPRSPAELQYDGFHSESVKTC